jgi:hypothetical protein
MAENVLYTAVYGNVQDALDDLKAIEQLHEDDLIGKFDAAVIDQEDGKPHIVKRVDRPRVRVIPEVFGGGALPRKELKDAASELLLIRRASLWLASPHSKRASTRQLLVQPRS